MTKTPLDNQLKFNYHKTMKNECGKTRKVNDPYEVWVNSAGWEWRVLKKYKSTDGEAKDPYSRWFCAVKSPMTMSSYDLGDVYVSEVKRNARKVNILPPVLDQW